MSDILQSDQHALVNRTAQTVWEHLWQLADTNGH